MGIRVLSLESLDKLSNHVKNNPTDKRLVHDFTIMKHELGLSDVPLGYDLPIQFDALTIPASESSSGLETDKQNVSVIYDGLPGLTAARATDERLWATLALEHLSTYTLARWPLPKKEDEIGNHIGLHWLCKGATRSRIRDNAIGRLWWMGRIVRLMEGWHEEDVVSILFNNSDYRQQLIDRNTSASALPVVSAILAITKEAFENGIPFNRPKFRNFMKAVNYQAGRSNLPAMTEIQLISLLKPIYNKHYDIA